MEQLIATAGLVEKGGEEVRGTISSVISAIDRRTLRKLNFGLERSFDQEFELSVTFSGISYDSPGVSLHAASSDQQWIRQTFSALSDEIEKGVPWWHALRHPVALTALAVASFLPLYVPLFIRPPDWPQWALLVFVVTTSIVPTLTAMVAKYWAFTPFEVLSEGSEPSGTRRIAFASAILLSIPTGILVNLMT